MTVDMANLTIGSARSLSLIPLLTEKYAGYVYPAYHMNRTHWVTVRLTADDGLIRDLLRLSHTLTDTRR